MKTLVSPHTSDPIDVVLTCAMLEKAAALIGGMTQEQVRQRWPSLHKVITCLDVGALRYCKPHDPPPLDPQ